MTFRAFLEEALDRTDLDWKRYQRPSIRRRVLRLCAALGFRSLADWAPRLEEDEEQRQRLLGLLSVPFSRFFRDHHVFRALENRVLPRLRTAARRPLRIWSAGCACGQELYSVAMLLEPDEACTLLGTDINASCLAHARAARFSEGTLVEIPAERRRRFFERVAPRRNDPRHGDEGHGSGWRLRTELLPPARFTRLDLLDAPYPADQDLILCRNAALTYFTGPARLRVARGLAASLAPWGALVIGRGEKLPGPLRENFEEDPPDSTCLRRRPRE